MASSRVSAEDIKLILSDITTEIDLLEDNIHISDVEELARIEILEKREHALRVQLKRRGETIDF